MSIWSQAKSLAAQTPAERNRYVDFLRAASITAVIVGHWMIATFYYSDGVVESGQLLTTHPQTQWLTWLFQVMPVFFIVGGYANAVSLESARKKNLGYAEWLAARLHRLVAPLLLLMIVWAGIALVMNLLGAQPSSIQFASQAAIIPTWFLAIYIAVAILAPLTYQFWRRFGFLSFVAFAVFAAIVDVLFFVFELGWPSWSNYFWVWLAVHQMGYAWRDGRAGGPARLLAYAVVGFAALAILIFYGPYPLAMVGSPDPDVSNTLPPKVTLIALGVFQFGVLLSLEKPMRRLLDGLRLWTATVLVNSMIMTVYLWHISVMILLVAVLTALSGIGLGIEPGTEAWWFTRPVWILVLAALLLPVSLLLSPMERVSRKPNTAVPSAARLIIGALLLCLGVALLAMYGYAGMPLPYLDVAAIAMVIVGAGVCGLLTVLRR